jgi:hypothetical protein
MILLMERRRLVLKRANADFRNQKILHFFISRHPTHPRRVDGVKEQRVKARAIGKAAKEKESETIMTLLRRSSLRRTR